MQRLRLDSYHARSLAPCTHHALPRTLKVPHAHTHLVESVHDKKSRESWTQVLRGSLPLSRFCTMWSAPAWRCCTHHTLTHPTFSVRKGHADSSYRGQLAPLAPETVVAAPVCGPLRSHNWRTRWSENPFILLDEEILLSNLSASRGQNLTALQKKPNKPHWSLNQESCVSVVHSRWNALRLCLNSESFECSVFWCSRAPSGCRYLNSAAGFVSLIVI